MPSESRSQQHYMGAAYRRAQSGHPRATDPKMTLSQLRDYASTSTKGLPDRVPKNKGHYGSGPVT